MNLVEFTESMDRIASGCTKKQLEGFVHEVSRITPAELRNSVLAVLSRNAGLVQPAAPKAAADLTSEVENARLLLDKIEECDLRFHADINEEYDDWYGRGEEFLYSDPEHLAKRLLDAAGLVHRCIGAGELDAAAELGRRLICVSVLCDGDVDITVDLPEAAERFMPNLNLQELALDTMYAAYCVYQDPQESIYETIRGSQLPDLGLQDLMQGAPAELQDLPAFLEKWAEFLAGRTDPLACRLYEEAVSLMPAESRDVLIRKNFQTHPESCLHALQDSGLPAEYRFDLGMGGVEKISPDLRIRAEIALETASLALDLKKDADTVEDLWFAAFESCTNAENCLRILLNCRDPQKYRQKMDDVLDALKKPDWSKDGHHALSPNRPSDKDILAVRFFLGEFKRVILEGISPDGILGWLGSFVDTGLSLFLPALNRGADTGACGELRASARAAIGFKPESYRRGLKPVSSPDDLVFSDCFEAWKASAVWPEGLPERALDHFERVVDERTDYITMNGRTKNYRECACYAAAIGQVRESMGVTGASSSILGRFAGKYRRYRSFTAALRAYGWKG